MEIELVSLVAFDHYASVSDNKVVFDRVSESEETEFQLSKPDDKFALMKNGLYVGVDSTLYSPDIRQQYYLTNTRGWYESFFVGTVEGSGLLVAFIQYFKGSGANHTDAFISVPVTIKRKL